jgi:hypothetical protein
MKTLIIASVAAAAAFTLIPSSLADDKRQDGASLLSVGAGRMSNICYRFCP